MRLITENSQILRHVPNIIPNVKGEPSLLQRLDAYLEASEAWAQNCFTGNRVMEAVLTGSGDALKPDQGREFSFTALKDALCPVVCCEALQRALLALDVVLTPNGFGVISSSNVAPASQHRVEDLAQSMIHRRDESIDVLLLLLRRCGLWLGSPQADYFGGTLFPSIASVDLLGREYKSRWMAYRSFAAEAECIEEDLAHRFISPQLLRSLRREYLAGICTGKRLVLANAARAYVIEKLRKDKNETWKAAAMVQFIRENPEDFPEWHASATAHIFDPPVFRNRKNSAGYWF